MLGQNIPAAVVQSSTVEYYVMPFDATSPTPPVKLSYWANPMTRAGILPVPTSVLGAHKAKQLFLFKTDLRIAAHRRKAACWREVRFTKFETALHYINLGWRCDIAPAEVYRVLAESRRRLADKNSVFRLGWLDTDPYVTVRVGFRKYCLAIWDGPSVLHLAEFRDGEG
jgi:hypothetical protein